MDWRAALVALALTASLFGRDRIAYIEFFGYQGIDAGAVRQALPFREGDKVSKNLKDQARAAVKRVTGREATDVRPVCCTGDGDSTIFIGLRGTSSGVFTLDPAPRGKISPPPELSALSRKMDQAEKAAILKGSSQEDGAPGYRLLKEPVARATELALREYALHHEEEIVPVLESSGQAAQRAMAADALGFGARTPRQLAALIRATRDADPEVRDHSTRALGEILGADPSAASQIPPDRFLDMIRSGIWEDRNKASLVLWQLTQSRDPQLLARLKSEAGGAIEEMAGWRPVGWAYAARVMLARIAGIPEEQINALAANPLPLDLK